MMIMVLRMLILTRVDENYGYDGEVIHVVDYDKSHFFGVDNTLVDRCPARYSPRLNRPTQLADERHISAILHQ